MFRDVEIDLMIANRLGTEGSFDALKDDIRELIADVYREGYDEGFYAAIPDPGVPYSG